MFKQVCSLLLNCFTGASKDLPFSVCNGSEWAWGTRSLLSGRGLLLHMPLFPRKGVISLVSCALRVKQCLCDICNHYTNPHSPLKMACPTTNVPLKEEGQKGGRRVGIAVMAADVTKADLRPPSSRSSVPYAFLVLTRWRTSLWSSQQRQVGETEASAPNQPAAWGDCFSWPHGCPGLGHSISPKSNDQNGVLNLSWGKGKVLEPEIKVKMMWQVVVIVPKEEEADWRKRKVKQGQVRREVVAAVPHPPMCASQ